MIFPRRRTLSKAWWAEAPSVPGTPGNIVHQAEVTESFVISDTEDRNIIAGKSVSESFALSDANVGEVTEATPETLTITMSDGGDLATASYAPLVGERNKPPVIEDVLITADTGEVEVDSILTCTIIAEMQGPFTEGEHEYQWYRMDDPVDGALTLISGATSNTYLVQAADLGKYLTVRARFIQEGGANPASEYMYAEPTDAVVESTGGGGGIDDGDIAHAWADFFDFEGGASVPSNWNTGGVSPSLINFGDNADWTAASASKPTYDDVNNEMVFNGAHRITGYNNAFPAVYEVWIKARFTGGAGVLLSQGNQTMFGSDADGDWVTEGLFDIPGDLNEHVFRIVYNGANSIFQVDGGEEQVFTDTSTVGQTLNLGCSNSGASFGEFTIKRFQRTQQNTLLTSQEVADKWLFHGFDTGGGSGDDIDHAWEDFFDIESGASIPANWNDAGVSPSLINLGTNANWTTVEATKPQFDVDKLVFANANRVTGVAETFPPVFEVWMKARYLGGNAAGVWLSHGNQTLFGTNSSGEFTSNGMTPQAGDTNEHVFRIVFNGANSIFQMDGGAEVVFDESNTTATTLNLGSTNSGSLYGDFELKRFQRTATGVLLTTQEVADKWAYHGF